jgi:hypothetical protein
MYLSILHILTSKLNNILKSTGRSNLAALLDLVDIFGDVFNVPSDVIAGVGISFATLGIFPVFYIGS